MAGCIYEGGRKHRALRRAPDTSREPVSRSQLCTFLPDFLYKSSTQADHRLEFKLRCTEVAQPRLTSQGLRLGVVRDDLVRLASSISRVIGERTESSSRVNGERTELHNKRVPGERADLPTIDDLLLHGIAHMQVL